MTGYDVAQVLVAANNYKLVLVTAGNFDLVLKLGLRIDSGTCLEHFEG